MSRGELVEIGGGVRIPDIVRRAGARLVEVGTTNRTRAADFEGPLSEGRARMVLRVHPSNFAQAGFVETPDAREVADLAIGVAEKLIRRSLDDADHRRIVAEAIGQLRN